MVELLEAGPQIRNNTKQKRYCVKFYLWVDGVIEYIKEEINTKKTYTLSEIPAYIEDVIGENYPDPTLVEIFVPLDILVSTKNLDWLEYKDKDTKRAKRLGMVYKVVLRSVDRQREPKFKIYYSKWMAKWRYLCQCLPMEKIPFQEKLNPTFLEKLDRSWPTNEKKVVGTVTQMPVKNLKEIVQALMRAGVPIIVWLKKEFQDEEINQLWQACNQQLLLLVEAVHTLRTSDDACDDQTHIGNYLTLIWENPYRILPEAKLEQVHISKSGE